VTVAVLDTGVDGQNPDLVGKVVRQTNLCTDYPYCYDPNPNNGNTADLDDNGHGTHVSGILAADTDNGTGIASLGQNVSIDAYKVLDAQGNGDTADVATGIYDAVQAGDRVISMSLANYSCNQQPSSCGPDPDEQKAVEYAIAHNVAVVAAAGNGNPGDNGLTYPASYPGVLAVGATDDNAALEFYSQWGPAANIAAPGNNIISTWNDGGLRRLSGTSMATPEVSAAAALLVSNRPSLTSEQITELLQADVSPMRGGNPINGGFLNVPAALAGEATPPTSYLGYDIVGADGSVYSYGAVGSFGDMSGKTLAKPVVADTLRTDGTGYWLAASDGGVFAFGKAGFYGSAGNLRLSAPVVGMAATPDGKGYWMVASDGGIFNYGDAKFYGSMGGVKLTKPVVGMAATPDGKGYWLVASDGGIFNFGDAKFRGSAGNLSLVRPVVGMAPTADGKGYWIVASDGGIFNYGDAVFRGSAGNVALAKPVVGMTATPDGRGYWLVASDGGIFNYGDARLYGSAASSAVPAPVVGIAN
jgi:hypothetical protein